MKCRANVDVKSLSKAVVLSILFSQGCAAVNPLFGAESATHIITNANVLTVDDDFSRATTFAIKDSRIIAVGDGEVLKKHQGSATTVIDADGKTVMPSFVDAHIHTLAVVQFAPLIDVGLTKHLTVEESIKAMKDRAAKAEEDDWLLFKNVDFGTQKSEMTTLTAADLDQVSADHPVFVLHAGGHVSSVNSKMLELMKITKETPDPAAGGRFGRHEDGEPNGVLYGFASLSAFAVVTPLQPKGYEEGMADVNQHFLSLGIGAVGDAGIGSLGSAKELDILLDLSQAGIMQFRVRGYLGFSIEKEWDELNIQANHGNQKVRVIGYKLSADGSNQARTGLQRENYMGFGHKGTAYLSEETLYNQIKDKSAKGFQLAIHGNGDASIDNIISAVRRAKSEGTKVIRPRIEHCSIVQDDQISALKELEISCSFLIGHVKLWGAVFKNTVFGLEKAEKLDRTGTFEKEGIPYSLHTDNGVTEFSPLEMVEIAVTRELFSEPGYVLAPEERASREMALRAITSTAAWQMLSEEEFGSIEVGKFADFVILEENPLTVEPDKIGDIKVVETWIDGQQVYSRHTEQKR
jgi:predicted amidohydrolase YtcJ